MTKPKPRTERLTPKTLETLTAKTTGIQDFLTYHKYPDCIQARALAYHLARQDGWSINRIARWSGRRWDTVNHALNTHNKADEAKTIYDKTFGLIHTW